MKPSITASDAAAFKARWAAVNAAEVEELRSTPIEQKARQLAALMLSVRDLGWTEALEAEEAVVRERWNRLRKIRPLRPDDEQDTGKTEEIQL